MTETTENVNVVETVEEQQQDNNKQTSDESTKTFTQDQVDEIIQKRLSKEQARAEKKQAEAISKAVEEYKNSVKEDERLANLSETERLNEELNKANAQIEELKAVQQRTQMLKATRDELSKRDLNVQDDLIEILTTDNAESTKNNIDALQTLLDNERAKWIEERSKGKTPNVKTEDNKPTDPFVQILQNIK